MADNAHVMEFTDANIDEVINESGTLSVVDFWATWCGPCVTLGPVVEELAVMYSEEIVNVGKLNVDENQSITARYGIRSIPAILFFKDSELVDTVVGIVPIEVLDQKIKDHL